MYPEIANTRPIAVSTLIVKTWKGWLRESLMKKNQEKEYPFNGEFLEKEHVYNTDKDRQSEVIGKAEEGMKGKTYYYKPQSQHGKNNQGLRVEAKKQCTGH